MKWPGSTKCGFKAEVPTTASAVRQSYASADLPSACGPQPTRAIPTASGSTPMSFGSVGLFMVSRGRPADRDVQRHCARQGDYCCERRISAAGSKKSTHYLRPHPSLPCQLGL